MDNSKDLLIWVTGLVGRSMGSGKFDASHIGMLTENAVAAFEEHLAPKLAQSQPAPRHASSAPQAATGNVDWKAGAQAMTGGTPNIPPESKKFDIWAGDEHKIFGRGSETWADILGKSQDGDGAARAALEKQAKAGLGKNPQYHQLDARRIARAKACVAMLRNAGTAGDDIPY